MDFSCEQTIAARASPAGAGRQGIVRVSGPDCREIVSRVFTAEDGGRYWTIRGPARHPGVVRLREVRTPVRASAFLWPGTRSYTGEPLCELRVAGAVPLVEATLEELFAAGAQPARAGEFTLRAFLAQRIDLLQAEAVLGVIDAPDEEHLTRSLTQLAGGLSGVMATVHEQLLTDLADLEAGLDFVEEDLDFVDRERLRDRLVKANSLLDRLRQQASGRMHSAPLTRVVLAGLPNSGKSTLFNVLLNRDSAMVSGRSGTTRDYLRGRVRWSRRDVELVDTPGYEREADPVMRTAFALRDDALQGAHLVIWCRASDLSPQRRERDDRERAMALRAGDRVIEVATKADLAGPHDELPALSVSAVTGEGVEHLRRTVLTALERETSGAHELLGSTAARCADSIRQALEAVRRARGLVEEGAGDELVAAELRAAVDGIGRITGRIHSDDILDRVFSRFCIGK